MGVALVYALFARIVLQHKLRLPSIFGRYLFQLTGVEVFN